MFWKKSERSDKSVKNLSEKDIQRQLYGNYADKVEVMDSSFLVKEKEDVPIRESIDAKAKKELNAELDGLKGEFKRLQNEVNRLKRDKESFERREIWFKPPFLNTRHLVIIGSLVVLIAIASVSFFTLRFFISRVSHKEATPTLAGYETTISKKENVPAKITTIKKPIKKGKEKKP